MVTNAPALPPASPAVDFRGTWHDRLCQAGLGAGALGAVTLVIAGLGDDQTVVSQGFTFFALKENALVGLGIVVAVILIASALIPHFSARFVGITLLGAAAATYGSIVFNARVDERFSEFDSYTVGDAGRMLVIAFLLTTVGLALALIGSPRIGRSAQLNSLGEPISTGPSGYAITSLVLSLCGIVTLGLTAPLGVAFGIAGMDDATKSRGARSGKGLAIAGFVVGLVFVTLGALIMSIGMGSADPSFNDESSREVITALISRP